MTTRERAKTRLLRQDKLITLFLMTEKGYEFLRETATKYKSLFNLIVVGNDKSIQKDYEEEIINTFEKNNPNKFNPLINNLIKSLQIEKNEDEKSASFEERIISESMKIIKP